MIALSKDKLQESFKVTGVYPFNPAAVDKTQKAKQNQKTQKTHGAAAAAEDGIQNAPDCAAADKAQPASNPSCQTCGRLDACKECLQQHNPLYRIGIVDKESGAVLLPPLLNTEKSKKRRLGAARILTGDEVL